MYDEIDAGNSNISESE